jgi:hypothetical protein
LVSNHRFNRDTRPSLRDGVNGVVRALPGVRDLIVTVARGMVFRRLSTSPRVPGPHAFASLRQIGTTGNFRITRMRSFRFACRANQCQRGEIGWK